MPHAAVHGAALPNHLPVEQLRLRSAPDGSVAVDPARAGWRHLSFRVATLGHGERLEVGSAAAETAVVLVACDRVELSADGSSAKVSGRPSPFDGLPSAWYLPPGVRGAVTVRAGRAIVAVASSPASGRSGLAPGPVVIDPGDIAVETRGAGNATRQVNHILAPGFPADRLELVEVLTPSGNWSSWPPHKHDVDDMPREAVLEEVYYYRFRRPEAWGIQRLYRGDRSRDALWEVRTGDVVLVTDGYHPFAAAHGDDAYYLNALAGDRRTMACSFDPDLDWVRAAWETMPPDPRVPLVPALAGHAARAR